MAAVTHSTVHFPVSLAQACERMFLLSPQSLRTLDVPRQIEALFCVLPCHRNPGKRKTHSGWSWGQRFQVEQGGGYGQGGASKDARPQWQVQTGQWKANVGPRPHEKICGTEPRGWGSPPLPMVGSRLDPLTSSFRGLSLPPWPCTQPALPRRTRAARRPWIAPSLPICSVSRSSLIQNVSTPLCSFPKTKAQISVSHSFALGLKTFPLSVVEGRRGRGHRRPCLTKWSRWIPHS